MKGSLAAGGFVLSAVFLTMLGGLALLSLASRRWRTTVVPWGSVPLFPLAILGTPPELVAGVLVLVALEIPGRFSRASGILATALVAVVIQALPLASLEPLLILPVAYLAASLLGQALEAAGGTRSRRAASRWAETASGVVLLGGSTLCLLGMQSGTPLPALLGLAIPAVLPALLADNADGAALDHAYCDVLSGLPSLIDALDTERARTLDEFVRSLHDLLAPLLGHELTVVAINPPFAGDGPSLGAHPISGEVRLRIAERLRRLFESRRAEILHSPVSGTGDEGPLLHPEFRHQVVVPVRHEEHLAALVAFLGTVPLAVPDPDVMMGVCSIAERSLRLHLANRWLRDRVASIERRVEEENRRLHHLLAMSQAIYTSPDLRSVTSNLVRAARLGFGLSWCAVLLDARRNGQYRLTARSGLPETSPAAARHDSIPLDTLQRVIAEGRSISRCAVLDSHRWPMDLGPTDHEHLVIAPIGSEDPPPAYLLLSPQSSKPMLELNEVRALEIVLDQAASVISSALHFEELKRQTLVDSLTGIANRRSLDTVLTRLLAHLKDRPISVAMIDADDFKMINDRFGHHVGDIVLRELASLLSRSLRARDFAARYGGEEFCAVLPHLSGDQASLVLDRVRRTIAGHRFAASELSHPLHVTVSIGIATFPEDGETPSVLLARADEALYEAKRLGKNRVVCTAEVGLWSAYDTQEPFA